MAVTSDLCLFECPCDVIMHIEKGQSLCYNDVTPLSSFILSPFHCSISESQVNYQVEIDWSMSDKSCLCCLPQHGNLLQPPLIPPINEMSSMIVGIVQTICPVFSFEYVSCPNYSKYI